MNNLALSYSDVYLVPKYSILKSRSEADVSVDFLGFKFKAPWLPANMESVISENHAKWLSENGYFYIMHRFNDASKKLIQRARAESWKLVSISVGVKEEDKKLILDIKESKCRVDFITIDIAHAHSILVKEMISFIKKNLPKVKVIAGNIATPEAVKDLEHWGADAVKVGIAGGAACSTKNMTGFHIPMFSCVDECVKYGGGDKTQYIGSLPFKDFSAKIPIIADGGIRENGDISKALVAGATMVMCGSMFAACVDGPGENVYHLSDCSLTKDKIVAKRYHGSASAKQKGEKKHVEGFEIQIPCNGLTLEQKYGELTESLKSAVSYAGGKNLQAFRKVDYVTIK